MTAEQIANIIRDVKEVSIDAKSINYSFTPAKGKVHIYHENGTIYFEIMKMGKDHLVNLMKQGSVGVFIFSLIRNLALRGLYQKAYWEAYREN